MPACDAMRLVSAAAPMRWQPRLHWLALVVEALEGSYNPIGIRRWFARPATAKHLGGTDAGGHGGQLMAVAPHRLGFRVCDRRYPFLWSGPGQRSGGWNQ